MVKEMNVQGEPKTGSGNSGDLELLRLLQDIDNGYQPTDVEAERIFSAVELNLPGVEITALPDSIKLLHSLQKLDLHDTTVTSLPESIGQLVKLQILNLSNSRITALPESMKHLKDLKLLSLDGSLLSFFPDWIGKLPDLWHLDLKGLTIPAIPKTLAMRGLPFIEKEVFGSNEPGINLYGVSLTEQDISVFLEHSELIPSLYEEQISLRECRVIFLGDGDSGKTYTIRRIQNGGKKESESKPYFTKETPGVEIVDWNVIVEGSNLDIHFWDFGGQEILHSMHRFFLTDQTCYVVTIKSREAKGTQRARYWLRNVSAFAPNSPILLYVNCWDNDDGTRCIDEPLLWAEFPNIVQVVYVSAKEAEDTDFSEKLMKPIIEMAAASKACTQTINRRWDTVRRAIIEESKGRHYLTRERYHELCKEARIADENAPDLLSFFNSLGVCFSYHRDTENKELDNYKLLNPVWLTNAIYAIIEEGMVYAQEGRISMASIHQMLGNRGPDKVIVSDDSGREFAKSYRRAMPGLIYLKQECKYIIDVAAARNLCYREADGTLFFPALCTNNTPKDAFANPDAYPQHIEYLLQYEYLPDSVIHQLMVRCRKADISVNHCWLRGMVLGSMDNYKAIVRISSDQELQIEIWSKAEHPSHELFELLHHELAAINKELNLKPKEFIVDGKDRFDIRYLIQASAGNGEVWGPDSGKTYNAYELLKRFYRDWPGKKQLPQPIGISDYRIASTQYYYVDKTMLIKDFLDERPMVSLFTRPRRFGKTLNMDMLRTFFEKTDEDTSVYFLDKAIWRQGESYRKYQGKYPVVFMTFKDVKCDTWANTLEKLAEIIGSEFVRHSELQTSNACNDVDKASFRRIMERSATETELTGSFLLLTKMLHSHYGIAPIIIIDEYDTPIQQGHTRNFYDQVISFMRNLFSGGLKDNKHLSFGFLTGILRVAKESIFSGLNNLTINSILDDKYSSYFGFTEDEVRAMAKYYHAETKNSDLLAWYGGYRFGNTEVFNPWSVINFFRNKCRLGAYWQSTGSNAIIGEVLKEAGPEIYDRLQMLLQGQAFLTYIDTNVIYPDIRKIASSVYSFLLVAGYLSIKSMDLSFIDGFMCEVALPNKEIALVYKKEILDHLSKLIPSSSAISIQEAIYTGNAEALQTQMRQLLLQTVSVYDTVGENFYHGLLLGLCAIMDNRFEIRSNRESGEGRYDIQMKSREVALPSILIELKATKKGDNIDLKALAQTALNQIEQKHYETELHSTGVTKILKYGVAFRGKEVEILMA